MVLSFAPEEQSLAVRSKFLFSIQSSCLVYTGGARDASVFNHRGRI